jgi:hypothetical protein
VKKPTITVSVTTEITGESSSNRRTHSPEVASFWVLRSIEIALQVALVPEWCCTGGVVLSSIRFTPGSQLRTLENWASKGFRFPPTEFARPGCFQGCARLSRLTAGNVVNSNVQTSRRAPGALCCSQWASPLPCKLSVHAPSSIVIT